MLTVTHSLLQSLNEYLDDERIKVINDIFIKSSYNGFNLKESLISKKPTFISINPFKLLSNVNVNTKPPSSTIILCKIVNEGEYDLTEYVLEKFLGLEGETTTKKIFESDYVFIINEYNIKVSEQNSVSGVILESYYGIKFSDTLVNDKAFIKRCILDELGIFR